MDQTNDNQSVDNDLQKAIDDITNNTNSDPVFSDPVAAPSSIPEGDTGELSEPVGPFPTPAPEPKVEITPPAPEPIAPVDPISIPDLETPSPAPAPLPPTETPAESPAAPAEAPAEPIAPAPEPPVPELTPTPEANSQPTTTAEIKKAALRDLAPLLDRVNLDSDQKFDIYRDIFEDLKDYSVLEPAYRTASGITDDTKRAEALLYLVESIDKM